MTSDELEKYCVLASRWGISRLKTNGLEIEFREANPNPGPQTLTVPNIEGQPTEDQMLMWSTDFMPDKEPPKGV